MLLKQKNTIYRHNSNCLVFDNSTRPEPPTLKMVRNGSSHQYTSNNIHWFPLKIVFTYMSSSSGDDEFENFYFDFSSGAYKSTSGEISKVSTNIIDGKHYCSFDKDYWWTYAAPIVEGKCWIQIVPCIVGEPELILTSSTQATTLTLFAPATEESGLFGASYGAAGYMNISSDDHVTTLSTNFTSAGSRPELQSGYDLSDASIFEAIIINTNVWNFSGGPLILRSNNTTLLGSSSTTLLKTDHSVSSSSVPSPALKYKGYLIPIYAIDANDVLHTWWDRSGFHYSNAVTWNSAYVGDAASIEVNNRPVVWKRLFCAYTNNLNDWLS